jgi:hypothetical protein
MNNDLFYCESYGGVSPHLDFVVVALHPNPQPAFRHIHSILSQYFQRPENTP